MRDLPGEILIQPEEDAYILESVPYLNRLYTWEHARRPEEEPVLRPVAMFGEEADRAVWDLFVELLFPSVFEIDTDNPSPLFGYRFQRSWQFGLLVEHCENVDLLLDFLGVTKSHRKPLMSYLSEQQFERASCPDPPPVRFERGLPKRRRFAKKGNRSCRSRSSNKYLYPTMGTTQEEDRLVPSQYREFACGTASPRKKRRRHSR